MKEIIKMLDENLEYKKHEIAGETINMYLSIKKWFMEKLVEMERIFE